MSDDETPPPVVEQVGGVQERKMSMLKTPPKFNVERSLDRYIKEVEIWRKVTSIPKEDQGVVVTLNLPEDGRYGDLKGRVMQMVEIEGVEGLQKVIDYLKENIGHDVVTDTFLKIQEFMEVSRKSGQTVRDFITTFDTAYHVARNKAKLDALPGAYLMYALLRNAKITENDWKLCMSSIDFTKQDQVYEDTKKALMKYCNENTSSMCQEGGVVLSEGTFWNDWGGGLMMLNDAL